jgi:hypothetical protein
VVELEEANSDVSSPGVADKVVVPSSVFERILSIDLRPRAAATDFSDFCPLTVVEVVLALLDALRLVDTGSFQSVAEGG